MNNCLILSLVASSFFVLSAQSADISADFTKRGRTINFAKGEKAESKFDSSERLENSDFTIITTEDYNSILSKMGLDKIASLPKPTYFSLEAPAYLLAFCSGLYSKRDIIEEKLYTICYTHTKINFDLQDWSWAEQGDAIIKPSTPQRKIAATYSLFDCVGIAISHPTDGIAFSHIDIKSHNSGRLQRLLEKFPLNIRKDMKVTLVSCFYSELLLNTYNTLINAGYDANNFMADIEPMFFDANGMFGPKDNRYMPVNIWEISLDEFKNISRENIDLAFNEKIVLPKSLIINLSTNELYSFNKNGDNEIKDSLILQNIKKDSNRYYGASSTR